MTEVRIVGGPGDGHVLEKWTDLPVLAQGLFREGETHSYATAYYQVEPTEDPDVFIGRFTEIREHRPAGEGLAGKQSRGMDGSDD